MSSPARLREEAARLIRHYDLQAMNDEVPSAWSFEWAALHVRCDQALEDLAAFAGYDEDALAAAAGPPVEVGVMPLERRLCDLATYAAADAKRPVEEWARKEAENALHAAASGVPFGNRRCPVEGLRRAQEWLQAVVGVDEAVVEQAQTILEERLERALAP